MTPDERTAERVARNDAIFRDANEGIRDAAEEHGLDGPIPFICECAEETCTAIVRLTLGEYERIRLSSTRFLNAPDHHHAAQGFAKVVQVGDGYEVVEKVGRAAEVVEALDPRTPS
jgi:hypothetical protein